ncbi:MAG: AAA domain-containing protein [Erysipelotrichaceae bacterium]|uniref:AAA domain-containing protein n=1 Tax=Floccifex sp. TaxID=2815810 RepID=UPI002A754B94|nr:AAA domain-containing protein [Floccifex sp.]MDD7281916.1 AAA domain-containing protein [Erysipelotrichaceae bacterium]MDY2958126.1 AAA domain-containing protein [Floccifex sp.]
MSTVKKVNKKNFSGMPFKVSLPLIHNEKDSFRINFNLVKATVNITNIVLTKIVVSNITKSKEYEFDYYIPSITEDYPVELVVNKEILLKNCSLSIHFLSQDKAGYTIVYNVDRNFKCLLNSTRIETLDTDDLIHFRNVKEKTLSNKISHAKGLGKYSLETYIDNIRKETSFLKHNGGRKYRINNGEFISQIDGVYSYSFDLESELFISEDSPVTVKLSDREVTGTALLCEGFQIVLLLDENIGEKVSSAFISVAPWKLLSALTNRLDKLNSSHKIALQLIKNDVDQSNKKISDIPMGQDKAMSMALSNPISIIWGPPGTGKTYTMAQIAIDFLKKGKTVLMVSHSNISVDGMIEEVYKQIVTDHKDLETSYVKKGLILRYGYVRSRSLSNNNYVVSYNVALDKDTRLKERRNNLVAEKEKYSRNSPDRVKIEKELKEINSKVKLLETSLASDAKLLATTISRVSVNSIFDDKKYDVVMFDEVSMAYVPQVIEAAMFAKEHFVCVGDFRQLSPIAQSPDSSHVLQKDIFTQLGIVDEKGNLYYHPWMVMLNEQRRMHKDISKFSSEYFYNNLLKNHSSVATSRNEIVQKKPFPNEAITFVDLTGTFCICDKNSDHSRFNLLSAFISMQIALEAVQSGQESIGIITPYQAQSRLIQAMISDLGSNIKGKIACSTVHQFQGSERDVIIFDAVESHPFNTPGVLMNKNDNDTLNRLINVALTRAKGKFITVANGRYWENRFKGLKHAYYLLINYIEKHGNVVSTKNQSLSNYVKNEACDNKLIQSYINGEYIEQFLKDIKKARERIIICLPEGDLDEDLQKQMMYEFDQLKKRNVEILVKTNDYKNLPKEWKSITWTTENFLFPIVLIDDKKLWYGPPVIKGKMIDKERKYLVTTNVFYRIKGKKTIEIIKSLTDIEYRISDGEKKLLTHHENDSKQVVVTTKNNKKKVLDGLGLYVHENVICKKCGEPMKLLFSARNKPYIKCNCCGNTDFLDVDVVNQYIKENHITCPLDGREIVAKVSKNGLYIRCEFDHFVNIKDI